MQVEGDEGDSERSSKKKVIDLRLLKYVAIGKCVCIVCSLERRGNWSST